MIKLSERFSQGRHTEYWYIDIAVFNSFPQKFSAY